MKKVTSFVTKYSFLITYLILCFVYLCLAFKNPYKANNLISNLEPSPDVYYYSVPAWNFSRGEGFKMKAYDVEISGLFTPLYSIYLVPVFYVFKDIRSYYFGNMLLSFLSIFLFLKIIDFLFEKKHNIYLKIILGLVLVTNFYFYNLPSLLMAENLLIVLTLASAYLILEKLNLQTLIANLVIIIFLIFTKISSFPVALIQGVVLIYKIIKSKFWEKIPKKYLVITTVLLFFFFGIAFNKILIPAIKALPSASSSFSILYIKKTLIIYIKEFVGINGSYLWFNNQHIEKNVGLLCVAGLFLSIFIKKYRKNILLLFSLIAGVTVFHSMMRYPEGRYISTVIPLFILFLGVLLCELRFKIIYVLFILMYFLTKDTVNGFYERKATSLKRQALNNRLEVNETPWSFIAISNINSYLKDEGEVYLGTLINPFYVMYFGEKNIEYVPLSSRQEFSGAGKGFNDQILQKDKTVIDLYRRLLNSGKKLYVTNYYLTYYKGSLDPDYYLLEKEFKFTQVFEGCLGECKLYKLDLKK